MLLSSSAASRISSMGKPPLVSPTTGPDWNHSDADFKDDYPEFDVDAGLEIGTDIAGIEAEAIFDEGLVDTDAVTSEDEHRGDRISAQALNSQQQNQNDIDIRQNEPPNDKNSVSNTAPSEIGSLVVEAETNHDYDNEDAEFGAEQLDAGLFFHKQDGGHDEEHDTLQKDEEQEQNGDEEDESLVPPLLLQWGEDTYSLFAFDPASNPATHDPSSLLFPAAADLFYCPLDQFLAALKDEFWPPEQTDIREAVIEFVGLDAEVGQDSPDACVSTLEDVWKLYVALQAASKIDVEGPLRLHVKDRARFLRQMEEWESLLTQGNAQDNSIIDDDEVDEADEGDEDNEDSDEGSEIEKEVQLFRNGKQDESHEDEQEEPFQEEDEDAVEDPSKDDSAVVTASLSRAMPVRRESHVELDDAELIAYEEAFDDDVETYEDPVAGASDPQGLTKRKVARAEPDTVETDQGKRPRRD